MRCVVGYEPSDEPGTLLDLVKGVGLVILIFMPGILGVYFYPNIWISGLSQLFPLLVFALIVLWSIGGMRK